MPERMSEYLGQKECEIDCQNICQKGMRDRILDGIYARKECEIEFRMEICQKECEIGCQNKCQKGM